MAKIDIPRPDHEQAQEMYDLLNEYNLDVQRQRFIEQAIQSLDDLEAKIAEKENA